MIRCLLLALATVGYAAELPRAGGYVNDFAGMLSAGDRAALESRLQDYEKNCTNEIAIAIVESLDGVSVEDYARRLFKAWGVGKREKNNGVLLLWAPRERKVRVQVGYGLEGTLRDSAAAEVVREITARFRQNDWVGGLNAGVDGIIGRLDLPPEQGHLRALGLSVLGAASAVGLSLCLIFGARRRRIAQNHPSDLGGAEQSMREAERLRRESAGSLDALGREAPEEVWKDLAGVIDNAAPELAELYQELNRVQAISDPWKGHAALKGWNKRFTALRQRLESPAKRLERYRMSKDTCPVLASEVRTALNENNSWTWGRKAKLRNAAAETYDQAAAIAAGLNVNWLLVHDLLTDAKDCLDCARHPGRLAKRERYWDTTNDYSPAYAVLAAQSASYSGGDSGGGFGGGDCGGGGASGSY